MTKHLIIIDDCRNMPEWVDDESVDLVLTSPPYAHLKNYGLVENQIYMKDNYEKYVKDLDDVWKCCFKALKNGGRMAIVVGDIYKTKELLGRYKTIPLHADIISGCERIGFDFMGQIIWYKKITVRPSGKGKFMGSFPYPRSPVVEYYHEYILTFKKRGDSVVINRPDNIADILRVKGMNDKQWKLAIKKASELSLEEWRKCVSGVWKISGQRQNEGHEAVFPDEIARRLIKMHTFKEVTELGFEGDIVLDPFLGSGTSMKMARIMRRNCIGFEICKDYVPIIKEKVGYNQKTLLHDDELEIKYKERI